MERILDTIPEFEAREAAQYVHCPWTNWMENLTWFDRAKAVAHYRTHLSIEAHVADAVDRKAKSESNKRKGRRG